MKIGLYGSTDKRPLAYALFKLLQSYGDVCFITKNRQYLRLTQERESGGHYQNVMIIATGLSYDEVWEEIGHNPEDFSHVIFDMDVDIPDDLDLTIACRTMVKDHFEEGLEWITSPIEEVKFDYDLSTEGFFRSLFKKKSKDNSEIMNISMTQELWKFVETVEACRIIPPVPKCGIVEVLSEGVAKGLNTDSNNIATLLAEGEEM